MPLTTPHPGRFDGFAAIHREVKQFLSPEKDFFMVAGIQLPQLLLTAMELSTGRVFQCHDPHSSPLPYLQLFKEIGRDSIKITSLPCSSKVHDLPPFIPSLRSEKRERQPSHQPPGGLEKRRSLPKKLTAAEAGSILKLDLATIRSKEPKERDGQETTVVRQPELRFVLCSRVSKSFEASEFVLGQVKIGDSDRHRLKEAHSMFLVNELTERLHLLEKAVQGLTSAASASVQAVPSENGGSVIRTTSSLKNMARHKPPFPDPSYDSGWMEVPSIGQSLVLEHKLNLQLFNNLRMYYMFDDGHIVYTDGLTSSGDGQYGLILTASDPDYVKASCAVDGPAYLDQVDRGNRVRTFATHFRVAIW